MATLNLIPNPTVLVVQAAIFLVNIVVVKKLFVEPYMSVRDKREKLTVGSKDEAARALSEAEATSTRIQLRLAETMAVAKKDREATREVASRKRQELLSEAESTAKAHVAQIETQIKADLAIERTKVPSIIASLTDEVYKVALS